jgi:putative flippase GtrA
VTRTTLVLRYTAFAILATLANLGVQRIVLMGGEGAVIFALAMVAGTAAGLVLKYILDKRYIFNDSTTGLRASGQQFLLYTVMGLVTTALFWATETAFWLIWRTDAMRELGAVLGLSVGYVVKYKLDSKYVFTRTEATA